MSVRHSLLAILEAGPVHGYGLKSRFEAATGDVWPLNVGQVYTTLGRLERDGLVRTDVEEGQKTYRITEAGRTELRRWFATPLSRAAAPRHELALKLVFAARSGPGAVADVVRSQAAVTGRSLDELTRVRDGAGEDAEVGWLLVLEALIGQTEAEIRWLRCCAERLAGVPEHAG